MSKHSANVAAAARESGNPHVRSVDASSGQGHGSGSPPATTASYNPAGNQAGAPYHSKPVNDDVTVSTQEGLTDNPYNQHDTNEQGVLGGTIMAKEAPPIDSPVPRGQHMPDKFGNYKADAVASVTTATPVGQPVTFPSDGVLGRS